MNNSVGENKIMKPSNHEKYVDEIFISYFTDPLCAWSWAFEKEWQQLKHYFGERLHVSYHMGGLIPDWKTFNDSTNSVTRPLQMGPVWMHITELTNIKLDHTIWMRNPPSSSYPACIAFKCAEIQSKQLADIYLFILREAAMIHGQNISKTEVLLGLADNPMLELEGFDRAKFKEDLFNGAGLDAFRNDLNLVQRHRITRFPTLVIRKKGEPSLLVSGYKKFSELTEIIHG